MRENEFAVQTFESGGYPDVASIEFLNFEDLVSGSPVMNPDAYPSH